VIEHGFNFLELRIHPISLAKNSVRGHKGCPAALLRRHEFRREGMNDLRLRLAAASDAEALSALQRNSMSRIASSYYSPRQLAAFFADPGFSIARVLESAELWLLESGEGPVACAGWRPTEDGAAEIRSVFVHAGWTRMGLASRLLDHVEARAAGQGAHEARLVATLSGERFYDARGYATLRAHIYDLDGVRFRGVEMVKPLTVEALRRSAA
jgi:putative acetyltransferase